MEEQSASDEEQKPIENGEEKQQDDLPTPEDLEFKLKDEQQKNLRLLAEMENARKRMQKDKHDTTRFAVENVISEFLGPLDNFENAFNFTQQASEEVQNWAKGFEMILTQFKDILSSHQVTAFQSEGMAFDPHLHEVIEMEETEKYAEGTVIQEFMKGYKSGKRVLRPAKVKVAKPTEKEEKVNEEKKESEGEE